MAKRATILLDLGATKQDFDLLRRIDGYLVIKGWTRRRAFIQGLAELMVKDGDTDMAMHLLDYILTKRGGRPKKGQNVRPRADQ